MTRQQLETKDPGWLEKAELAAQHAAESVSGRILPATLIAQLIDESNDGLSEPGDNALGIKAGSSWKGPTESFTTHEFINGRDVRLVAVFRKYSSLDECCKDYAQVVTRLPEYAGALSMLVGKDPAEKVNYLGILMPVWEAYTRKLGSVYATNPAYADNLVQIIRDCELLGYDLAC